MQNSKVLSFKLKATIIKMKIYYVCLNNRNLIFKILLEHCFKKMCLT